MSTSRALSFGGAAAAYARHRPDYPEAGLEWALAPAPGTDLLDLAAGTGKLTAMLLRRPGAVVTAVEPDPAMLDQLRTHCPAATALLGTAEQIPLPDASVDAVLAGQAMHWFDLERAMPEIARVLRPGGVLAGLWNAADFDVEWVAGYHEALGTPRYAPTGSRNTEEADELLPHADDFTAIERVHFPHSQRLTIDGLVDVLGTQSWSLIADPAERDAAFARLRSYLQTRPETSSGPFDLPFKTTVLRAVRR